MPDNFVDRVVRPRELGAIDGLSRSARRREQLAGRYPPFKQFSQHCVGVLLSEVLQWMRTRPLADNRPGPGRGGKKTTAIGKGKRKPGALLKR